MTPRTGVQVLIIQRLYFVFNLRRDLLIIHLVQERSRDPRGLSPKIGFASSSRRKTAAASPGFRRSKSGWHAFRRGLATNLHRPGVPDKTIQSILRHSNLLTTMNAYVKSVPPDAVAAMRALEAKCTSYAPNLDRARSYVA